MKKLMDEFISDAKIIEGHALQPGWYRILKVFVLVGVMVLGFVIFGASKTDAFIIPFIMLSLIVHLLYRWKTERFTKSWLDFIVTEVDG